MNPRFAALLRAYVGLETPVTVWLRAGGTCHFSGRVLAFDLVTLTLRPSHGHIPYHILASEIAVIACESCDE